MLVFGGVCWLYFVSFIYCNCRCAWNVLCVFPKHFLIWCHMKEWIMNRPNEFLGDMSSTCYQPRFCWQKLENMKNVWRRESAVVGILVPFSNTVKRETSTRIDSKLPYLKCYFSKGYPLWKANCEFQRGYGIQIWLVEQYWHQLRPIHFFKWSQPKGSMYCIFT